MNKIFTANLPPVTPRQSRASGIAAADLLTKELDCVTGGLRADPSITVCHFDGTPIVDEWID